jgi:hypothetical protein
MSGSTAAAITSCISACLVAAHFVYGGGDVVWHREVKHGVGHEVIVLPRQLASEYWPNH